MYEPRDSFVFLYVMTDEVLINYKLKSVKFKYYIGTYTYL